MIPEGGNHGRALDNREEKRGGEEEENLAAGRWSPPLSLLYHRSDILFGVNDRCSRSVLGFPFRYVCTYFKAPECNPAVVG